MKSIVFAALVFCSFANADINATGGGVRESSGAQAAATGESFDTCVARWAQKHQGDKELNIGLASSDATLVEMKKCTESSTLVSSDPEKNRDLVGRIVTAWAKTRTADASGSSGATRVNIKASSGGDGSVKVISIGPPITMLPSGRTFRVIRVFGGD